MKLSVIVCTHNRSYAIISCLDSIVVSLTRAMPIEAEIVVVDNASTDDTNALVQAWAKACPFPVTICYEPRKGIAFARNCGLSAARGELFACTDDDCHLAEDYVTQLLAYDAVDTGLVLRGGRINLGNPSDLAITIKTDDTRQQWSHALRSAKYVNVGDSILGANMAMRRGVFTTLGLFDVRFGAGSSLLPAGEDTDYVMRAYLAGILIEYVPDMAVTHYHGRKLVEQGNRLMYNYMIGSGALYTKYCLRQPNFLRPAYWDLKNAFKELLSGTNSFWPDFHFSHRDKIRCYLIGAKRYLFSYLRGPFQRSKTA